MAQKEEIKKLLNNINLGTNKAKVGEYILGLEKLIEDLTARVVILEAKP